MIAVKPRYFRNAAEFRRWLADHTATHSELWVGYFKRGSQEPSMTWPESVDQALCHGWIDGIRKSIDPTRYMIRFTPRKPGSVWSSVNIRKAEALIALGLMTDAGLAAFGTRRESRSGIYSYEQRPTALPGEYAAALSEHQRAQAFFAAQPPSYRKAAIWWVLSAKQEATRRRRLARLIEDSGHGRRIAQFLSPGRKQGARLKAAAPRP